MVYVGVVVLVVGLTVPMDEPVPAMKLEYQGVSQPGRLLMTVPMVTLSVTVAVERVPLGVTKSKVALMSFVWLT